MSAAMASSSILARPFCLASSKFGAASFDLSATSRLHSAPLTRSRGSFEQCSCQEKGRRRAFDGLMHLSKGEKTLSSRHVIGPQRRERSFVDGKARSSLKGCTFTPRWRLSFNSKWLINVAVFDTQFGYVQAVNQFQLSYQAKRHLQRRSSTFFYPSLTAILISQVGQGRIGSYQVNLPSGGPKRAASTVTALARAFGSDITVAVVDEVVFTGDRELRSKTIRWHLAEGGFENFSLIEKEGQNPGAAIGEIADDMNLDLVVLGMESIHSKQIDGNTLAEFVPCPVLLLP